MATAYNKHEPWEMGVHKRNGVVYLDVHQLPERPQRELDRRRYNSANFTILISLSITMKNYFLKLIFNKKAAEILMYFSRHHKMNDSLIISSRCYWGYCFESLATENPSRGDGEGIHHVDANVEFCAVLKTKLGAHRVLMGAEMDCCDSTNDGKRFYVELKTHREVHLIVPHLKCMLLFCIG